VCPVQDGYPVSPAPVKKAMAKEAKGPGGSRRFSCSHPFFYQTYSKYSIYFVLGQWKKRTRFIKYLEFIFNILYNGENLEETRN
jgi:hypothetical protein